MTNLDKTQEGGSDHTWSQRLKNLIWGVATIVTGSFVVALLHKSEIMDSAVAFSLSWLIALIALPIGLALIFGRTSDNGEP
jgi:hypothetical protein